MMMMMMLVGLNVLRHRADIIFRDNGSTCKRVSSVHPPSQALLHLLVIANFSWLVYML